MTSTQFSQSEVVPDQDALQGEANALGQSTGKTDGADGRVYAALSRALLSGKLRPGTPLRERALAETFGCTRGAVRKALSKLGTEKRVVLEHNRGAFVPNPSIEDMRSVYRARRIVESGLITTLFGTITAEQIAVLSAHVQAEQRAFKEGRRADSVRLAGEFHVLLADLAGSSELSAYLQRLVSNTEMYKALYDSAEADACAPLEHADIIEELMGDSLTKALATALEHLEELEERVVQGALAEQRVDIARLLSENMPDAN
jgi:DNA-binding GntR family transcriptional regulator